VSETQTRRLKLLNLCCVLYLQAKSWFRH